MDDQLNWRTVQNEKITKLKERLHRLQKQLKQGWSLLSVMIYDIMFHVIKLLLFYISCCEWDSPDKAKVATVSNDWMVRYESLESSFAMVMPFYILASVLLNK